jgi:regulatory GntR family protein
MTQERVLACRDGIRGEDGRDRQARGARKEKTSPTVPPFVPISERIVQIATMTATGVLEVGARLPTIRQLAKDLGVAGGTVARAYRELEADGVIETRGRHGHSWLR